MGGEERHMQETLKEKEILRRKTILGSASSQLGHISLNDIFIFEMIDVCSVLYDLKFKVP